MELEQFLPLPHLGPAAIVPGGDGHRSHLPPGHVPLAHCLLTPCLGRPYVCVECGVIVRV